MEISREELLMKLGGARDQSRFAPGIFEICRVLPQSLPYWLI
jgi:hypothetical protein